MTLTPEEQARILRIHADSTAKIPKRAYSDDVLFLIDIIARLAEALASK